MLRAAPAPALAPWRWQLTLLSCLATFYLGTLTPWRSIRTGGGTAAVRLHGIPTAHAPAEAATRPGKSFSLHGTPQGVQSEPLLLGAPWCRQQQQQLSYRFPKLIHQTVKNKSHIPCQALAAMRSWVELNPGYEHRLYDDADCDAFVQQHYPQLLTLYRGLSTPVERSDLWRYLVLHRHGGVYADQDVQCMKPIDTWNARSGHDARMLAAVVFVDGGGRVKQVTNFIMAAMPCHEVLATVAVHIAAGIAADALRGESVKDEKNIIARTGPGALTAAIADHARQAGTEWPPDGQHESTDGPGTLLGGVRLMPTRVMSMGWDTQRNNITCEQALKSNPAAWVCHLYFGTWKSRYVSKFKLTYSEDCKYWQ